VTKKTNSDDGILLALSLAVQQRREALGISQEELASRSGLHRTYISDVERGARNLSLKNLNRLSIGLEVPSSTLIYWAEMNLATGQEFSEGDPRDLWDNAPWGYHSLDRSENFLQVNDTELNWLGYSREELLGSNISSVMTSDSLKEMQSRYRELESRGWVRNIEVEMLRKDQSSVRALLSAKLVNSNDVFLMSRMVLLDAARKAARKRNKSNGNGG
jgi:PAS domain S-box-containing protein